MLDDNLKWFLINEDGSIVLKPIEERLMVSVKPPDFKFCFLDLEESGNEQER